MRQYVCIKADLVNLAPIVELSHKPEFRSGMGSVPAPGAVFRALAENLVRTE
jgi:hypothetical protein